MLGKMKYNCFEKTIKTMLKKYFDDDRLVSINLTFKMKEMEFFVLESVNIDYIYNLTFTEKDVINLFDIIKFIKKDFEDKKFYLGFTDDEKINIKLYGKTFCLMH